LKPQPIIEINAPRLFRTPAIFVIWAYGILLIVPLAAAFLAVTMMRLSFWTMLIPLFTLVATAWFVPVGQGNSYIVKRLARKKAPGSCRCLVQLTLAPRLRKGLRATLEDADDFGYLGFDQDGFTFEGDSIQLRAPYLTIKEAWQQNVGWRGRFIYGPRITVVVDGVNGVRTLEFAERSSTFISQSKNTARELWRHFERARQAATHSSSASNSSSSSSSSSAENSIKSARSTKPSETFATASQGSPFSARG
jgi:hypothetical protein